MDVAEQALTALAMLSRRHGKAILQAVRKCCHVHYAQVIDYGYKSAKKLAIVNIFAVYLFCNTSTNEIKRS